MFPSALISSSNILFSHIVPPDDYSMSYLAGENNTHDFERSFPVEEVEGLGLDWTDDDVVTDACSLSMTGSMCIKESATSLPSLILASRWLDMDSAECKSSIILNQVVDSTNHLHYNYGVTAK